MRMKVWMEIKKFNELEFYFLFMNFSSYANLKIKWPLQIFFVFCKQVFVTKILPFSTAVLKRMLGTEGDIGDTG